MKGGTARVGNTHFEAQVADFAAELFGAEEPSPLRHQLHRAILQELTPRQQEVIALYYGEGLTQEHAAARLGIHKSTVSRTLQRGEERLKRCLKYGANRLLVQSRSAKKP